MALEVVGGAFLSGLFQEIFHKMASREVMDFIKGKKQTKGLLNRLEMTLRSVNVVLDDAEEKQLSSSDVKEWLDELKEAVFGAEDLLTEIKTEAMRRKLEAEQYGSSTSKLQQLVSFFFHAFDESVDPKIEEILERLDFIASQKDALNLKTGAWHRLSMRVILPSTSLVDDSGVYGRYEDKETIAKLLLSDDASGNKVGVIPIVGMGGIGKTTLAQLLYNDARVKQHFDLQAWVCVSENFEAVRSVTICGSVDLNLLQVNLKEALMGKKFLFVLDDVWNENYIHWDVLRCPFEFGVHGSRIIVTTRNEGVGSMMGTLPTHYLLQISEEDCLLLFAKHAFRNADLSLPLAAKSLGGLLCSKVNLEEWVKILKSDIWEFADKGSTILPALWLRYYYLPPHLKRCFAYCSIFPKGYVFERSQLVFLWMAEDLLQPKNKKLVEEVGEEYFDQLISRSFFQHSSTVLDGFIMHDLISDLAKSVSGDFCFRLEKDDNSLDILTKTRHFSYMRDRCNGFENFEAINEAKYLRTFLPLQLTELWSERFQMLDKVLHDLLPTLRCLRVLNLSRYDIKELPSSIGNLKHLRYLNLSWTSIEKLPDTVCNLCNLQTLLLSHCEALAHLPANLGRPTNLRHLDIGDVGGTNLVKMPPHMGKLKDLQMLSDFVLDQPTARNEILELKELKHLQGTLRISGIQNIANAVDAFAAKMWEKKSLAHLILEFGGYTEDSHKDREVLNNLQPRTNLKELTIDSYRGTRFPGWLGDHYSSNI
ncbi:putative P-loop containing nucleoside triphosphate hydrolase, leucine-rich repeat domain, L [Rosa chinensis]|uniref:Putative P-loop containing nucleoside triphosphate hydrolase, leucine-rich repeat domain, L n=1 Tax=Rosa chinensis TaxID=74649 RepID=A0A2P6QDG3_ROSCH|nr:putative P-loop containing nucleoside triphosphate hydrolase, leucine-rich repeat domain, L [Rosa chinensis]